MAVRAFTRDPEGLVRRIRNAVAHGRTTRWSFDDDGDLTHTAVQWKDKAWLRPHVLDDRVVFNILGSTNEPMTKAVYAAYHGRFVETLLTLFDEHLIRVTATANAVSGDMIGPTSSGEDD